MHDFDVTGPLPGPGTTLLEASAGTGKTWTIAALVARHVAEGVLPLDRMLVVTFGRAASQELRTRVRERLVEVERTLAAAAYDGEDVLLRLLLDVDEPERERRLSRVRAALTDFDGAAILTIHQFCHTVLRGLGVAGDTDPEATLVEELDDLLDEVIDDLYLREVAAPGSEDRRVLRTFPHATARHLGRVAALGNPLARLEPADAAPGSDAHRRVRFAEAVRAEFARRKRRQGVLSYDDLLRQLADALEPLDSPARARMRERWRLVLVDEFQDTDPTQWQVFRRAFHEVPDGEQPPALVLIGDPKQAIYAFRGGDVFTYLEAKRDAGTSATLSQNFRTDRAVLDCINVLLEGAQLGDPQIVVHPARAAHPQHRLAGEGTAPFRLRALTRSLVERSDPTKLLSVGQARSVVAADLAAEVLRMLTSDVTYEGQPLEPRQIAVLAHTRRQLHLVREALGARGIPSVLAGSGTVFDTDAASAWLALLEALEQPHRTDRVRALALTSFFGETLDSLVAGGEERTEELSTVVRDWLDLFRTRGVAAVFEAAVEAGLDARLLGVVGGERDLTDLRHLAEILHREVTGGRAGVVALLTWMREQMREDREDVSGERTRRLDSDARAVQLVTIHGSKGLEYPVVLLPFTFDRWEGRDRPDLLAFHDQDGRRVLHVSGSYDRETVLDDRARREDLGERLRLLYVAMTRTQAQLVTWWAPTNNTATAELQRVLLGRKPGEAVVPDSRPPGDDADALAWLRAWEGRGAFALERVVVDPVEGSLPEEPLPRLDARRFTGDVDHRWRRTSYTGLSTPAHEAAAVSSESDVQVKDDEPDPEAEPTAPVVPAEVDEALAVPSPMAGLPMGAQFGSLVHAVLEHADPEAPDHGGDLLAELRARVEEQWLEWPQEVDREVLAEALLAVCETPLGPVADMVTLRDLPLRDRLMELDFELPLGGGDTRHSTGGPTLADVGPLLERHLPEGDPVRGWAEALRNPLLGDQDLRGYLTGSVDVVLRVGGRYLVVDYKTNWLGPIDQPLTAAAYTPAELDAAMGHSDYPLQALLYAVVLHRFLRWRLSGYDPAEHLGGVLYLYLRGMCGADTPLVDGAPCGVFTWRPPVALVEELSDLLDGGAA